MPGTLRDLGYKSRDLMYCPLVGKQEKQISKVTTVNTRAKYYRRFTEEVLTELVLKKHFDFCHMDK